MKRLLLFLFLVPLAFAWQTVAALAMMTSFTLLGIIYMVGYGFGVNELKIMAKDELFQMIAVVILMVALIGTDSLLNAISTNDFFIEGDATTMQESAGNIINDTREEMVAIFNTLNSIDRSASIEASKAAQCSIMGMGYSVSGCGGYSMLATPISMAGGIVGFTIGELSAMSRFLLISENYALALLLPLGIVLRTIRLTRGAGGLLIALGIAMHIMLPAGIIFTEKLYDTFVSNDDYLEDYVPECIPKPDLLVDVDGYSMTCASGWTCRLPDGMDAADAMCPSSFGVHFDCNPGDTGRGNANDAINGYNIMRSSLREYLVVALLKATLGPVISLLMMASSIRALTALAGAEVDVSAISRFV